MHKGSLIWAALCMAAGCAAGDGRVASGSSADAAPPAALPIEEAAPAVDHHLHIMGPAITTIVDGAPPLAPVKLPPALERLMAERADAWSDKAALARVYAEDSLVLSEERRGWLRGGREVAAYMSTRFGRPIRLSPVEFQIDDSTARISGYYVRGEPSALQYVGYFTLTARADRRGRWRITSEVPRFPVPPVKQPETADHAIEKMDKGGIRRAVILSEGFWADGPLLVVADPYPKVVAENDWTAREVARFPDRLIAFCSFNPIANHALRELERCARNPAFRGLKFSFAMSAVDLKNPDHARRVREVFAAANRHKLAIVAHTRGGNDYTGEHVEIFLRQVMSAAPDIPVQIAHLWGGEGYSESALTAFAEAVAAGRPETRNLYFDVAEVWAEISGTGDPETQRTLARRIRQIGLDRILFGTDGRVHAAQAWRLFKGTVPLTPAELRVIAGNVAPYLREPSAP